MATHITGPTVIAAAGNLPKVIEEFVGLVNSKTDAVSIARMRSPTGWVEPGQTPNFEWVQYSTPGFEGAEYIAVCLPAFSPGTVHRDS
jgi:hypothetical protein